MIAAQIRKHPFYNIFKSKQERIREEKKRREKRNNIS